MLSNILFKIGGYKDLDSRQHVIALIDPEMCINCGKKIRIRMGFPRS